jgi:peroxiredoxin
MKTKLTVSFLIFLVLWGVYDVVQHHKTQVGIEVGNRAPNIVLKNLNGKTTQLSNFRGDIVIVNFWATWCTPCHNELPVLNKFYKENKNKKIVILGLNATSTERNKLSVINFSKKNHMIYPILLDSNGKYSDLFQVKGYPITYFINSKGVIKRKYIGQITAQKLTSILSTIQ